jgi:hypothetical protein
MGHVQAPTDLKPYPVFFLFIKLLNTIFKVADDIPVHNERYSPNKTSESSFTWTIRHTPCFLYFINSLVSTIRTMLWKLDAFSSHPDHPIKIWQMP